MKSKVLSRKTWHEVIDDEQAYVLADYGVRNIILTCVATFCDPGVDNYEAYCRKIVNKARIPDEFSYNEVLSILDDYLRIRWEEYKNGKDSAAD